METEDDNFVLNVTEETVLKITRAPQNNKKGKCDKELHINKADLHCLLNNIESTEHIPVADGKIFNSNLNVRTITDTTYLVCKLKLKELHLSNINLKNIPLCLFSGLEVLELLDLSHNDIVSFNIEPRCHSSLKDLRLNNNKLTNLPKWILALRAPNLEKLDYSYNKLDNLKCIFNKYDFRLTRLKMQNCYLRDQDLKFFKNIKYLQHLDMSNEQGECAGTNFFEDLDKLFVEPKWKDIRVLKLDNLLLSVIPNGIVWLESLSELYLTNNSLSWLPNGMEYLVNLEVIDVSHNDLTYFPAGFFLLQYIRVLKAACNRLVEFDDVSTMEYLEVLDLFNNELEDFANIPSSIKYIDLEMNFFETENCHFYSNYLNKCDEYRRSFADVRQPGPRLRHLVIESWTSSRSSTSSESPLPDNILELQFEENSPISNENWDEPYTQGREKHPDVTFSDDDWDGSVSTPLPQLLSTASDIDRVYNDDWMFCDAEEDGS